MRELNAVSVPPATPEIVARPDRPDGRNLDRRAGGGGISLGRRSTNVPVPDQLDQAWDEVSAFDFEVPNPFINHAPMACEALAALGLASAIDNWIELHVSVLRDKFVTFDPTTCRAIQPVRPAWGHGFAWDNMLGDHRFLPEWMGYFERAIDDEGWREVVRTWVPRLMPGQASAAFHGVIRTSHAVRALDGSDTGARRAELARAIGNWACWFAPGQPTEGKLDSGDPGTATVHAAARAAAGYVSKPHIFTLHGVTGGMAVHLLSGYLDPFDEASALSQLEAEYRVLYRDVTPSRTGGLDAEWDPQFALKAAASFDPHQIKLVEACQRGLRVTGDPNFVAAARLVTAGP